LNYSPGILIPSLIHRNGLEFFLAHAIALSQRDTKLANFFKHLNNPSAMKHVAVDGSKPLVMKIHLQFLFLLFSYSAFGQTLTDGLMMSKKDLCTGFMYTHDQWTNYWEGELKRENENIGTLTTQSLMWVGTYGITDKLNIIAMVPYVKTEADQGTLHFMEDIQDLTFGVKYNFFKKEFEKSTLKAFGVLGFSTPLSDYTPDFYPLSLGAGTTNIFYRLTANYRLAKSFYVNASGAYTWRSNTSLDRPAYYTDDQLYFTDEVQMPNVFDFVASFGYINKGLQVELSYMQQNTLGGSDIRRQDMPFVSNRMNFSKAGALVMYYLPKPKNFAVRGSVNITIAGRNVGESTTLMGGLLYTFHFSKFPKI
jgi:hypothetical protein